MRIGFACLYVHPDQDDKKLARQIEAAHNQTTTTAKWCRINPDLVEERVWTMVQHNLQALSNVVDLLSRQPLSLRMFRIGSGVLPLYTHQDVKHVYQDTELSRFIEQRLAYIGAKARLYDIKLSFHPGQYCVLASDRDDVVQNSIEEFEYHAHIIRLLGYGKSKLDFKCNVHLSGRGGARQFRKTYSQLSPEARNSITLENDEYTSCLDDVLELADLVGIVLDVHHYWIHQGQYIHKNDPRLSQIVDSWHNVRPTIHYSYSRQDYVSSSLHRRPDIDHLIAEGYGKNLLRAHSDVFPNPAANNYVLELAHNRFDIMCECKAKNIGSVQLYQQAVKTNLLK